MDDQILKTILFLTKNINMGALIDAKEITDDLDRVIKLLKSSNLNALKICEVFDENEFSCKQTLIVTDCSIMAKEYIEKGYPIIGYLHINNQHEQFSQIGYLIEGFAEVDATYFVNVFKRLKKLPWDIMETSRCRIREITVEDITALYEIYKEPSITLFMENLFEDPEEEKEYVLNYISCIYGFYGYGMWIIELKTTGEIIGRAGLEQNEDTEELELGYMIAVPYQRLGYGKEVCSAILQYGCRELGATVIGTMIEDQNQASEALCFSLGFQFQEKVLRKNTNYKKFIWNKKHT